MLLPFSLCPAAKSYSHGRAVYPLAEVSREATGPAAVSVAAATNSYTMGGKWLAQLIITDQDEAGKNGEGDDCTTGQKRSAADMEGQTALPDAVVKKRFFIGRYDSESDAKAVVRLVRCHHIYGRRLLIMYTCVS